MTTGRSLRGSKRAAAVLLSAFMVAFGARASAHRLDELLQATRIAVDRDRVQLEITLTPGTAVADRLIRSIDADRNGVLSLEEQQAYAGRVLGALTLRLDDSMPLRLQPASSSVPDLVALRGGDGAIVIRAEAGVPRLPAGEHRLLFRNQNDAGDSVYLANALVPEDDDVAVTGQQRTGNQSELTIAFVVRASSAGSPWWVWIGVGGAFLLAALLVSHYTGFQFGVARRRLV
jgi:hypothetical protein